jgi:hypothetical protein
LDRAARTGFAGRTSGGNLALYGTNVTTAQPSFYGFDGFNNTAFSAGVARTNLGLSTTDAVTFQSLVADQLQVLIGTNLYVNLADDVSEFFVPLQLEDELAVVGAATFSTNVTVNGNLSVGSFTTTTPRHGPWTPPKPPQTPTASWPCRRTPTSFG